MNIETLKQSDEVFFAGNLFKVAEIKDFPHGKMIGVYDEPPTKHIDYLNPNSVSKVNPCYSCQGGGCPVCNGFGKIVE